MMEPWSSFSCFDLFFESLLSCQYHRVSFHSSSHLYIVFLRIHTHHTPSFTVTILFTLVIACTLTLCSKLLSLPFENSRKQKTLFLSQKFSCKTTRRKNPLFLRIQCSHSILQQKLRPRRLLSVSSHRSRLSPHSKRDI